MKYILIFSLVVGFAYLTNAQKIDSLYNVYTLTKDQKTKDVLAKKILNGISLILYQSFNPDDYVKVKPEIVIDVASQYNKDTLLGDYCLVYSLLATKNGDYNKAFELAFKSLKYFEKIKDTLEVSVLLKQIGVNYKSIKNYPEAIKYYLKAIDLLLTVKAETKYIYGFIFNSYQGLAMVYLENHNIDSAFNKLHYAYNIYVNNEKYMTPRYKIDYGLRLNYLYANLYLQKNDTLLAETYFEKCFTVNTDSLFPYTEHYMDACLLYSNFKKDQGDYMNALHYATLAYNYAMKGNYKRFIADACEQLCRLYDKTKLTDSAYHYLKQTLIYRDSISNGIIQSQIQNTTLLLYLDEKEQEVKLAEDKLKYRQNVQYAASAIGIIVLLLLYLVFSRSILIGTRTIEFIGTVILLLVFEFIDLFIHPYVGKWSDESPLIMLLALVLIASLLFPLHHKIEHWTTKRLIEKNKKIRLAYAKKTIKELEEKEENEQSELTSS